MEVMAQFFQDNKVGLILDVHNPIIGASLDGLVEFLYCGKGTLEIKYQYSCQEHSFEEVAKKKLICLEDEAGHFILKKDHDYCHRIQVQMKLCGVFYSNFCCMEQSISIVSAYIFTQNLLNLLCLKQILNCLLKNAYYLSLLASGLPNLIVQARKLIFL